MSAIIDFYTDQVRDAEGRSFEEILSFSDEDLENSHDYIQWLFPLPEASRFYERAPLLSDADISTFKADPVLLDRVREAVARMKGFYNPSLEVRCPGDHNHLRITRIIRFLTLIGLNAEAHEFYHLACNQWAPNAFDRSKLFWAAALESE